MKNMITQKKKKAEEAKRKEQEMKNRPKIQEVDVPETKFKKIQIEEDSEDSDDTEALNEKKAQAAADAKRKKQFDQNTLSEAQDRAMEEQKQRLMSQVPKTAAGFNRDFKALKKDLTGQLAYLKRIPLKTLSGYFTKTELETASFSEILRTLAEKVEGAEDAKWAADFLITLSKSFKFDMTVMFIEDEEEEWVSQIVDKIKPVNAEKADQVKNAYSD